MARKNPLSDLTIAQTWAHLSPLPLGKKAFSKLIGVKIPYSGSMGAEVQELADGHAVVTLKDRRAVRNHLDCVHAIALMNLGELCTGLAVFHRLDGRAKGIVTDLRMEYLKKARGTITAHCDIELPTEPGKHDLTVEGALKDKSGETVAKVWATWQIKM
jgi:acyl-coenzyme A thioesterase PaaI-like protein